MTSRLIELQIIIQQKKLAINDAKIALKNAEVAVKNANISITCNKKELRKAQCKLYDYNYYHSHKGNATYQRKRDKLLDKKLVVIQ